MTLESSLPSADDFIGAPRFRLVRPLGEGGMGVVYEVFDTERRVHMALKTLHQVSAKGVLLFKREFRALCDLRHPNRIGLADLVNAGGQWFFTMELVEGVDLVAHVRTRDPLASTLVTHESDRTADTLPVNQVPLGFDELRVRATFRQLAAALSALHRAGMLHRDLKPSNVLVTPEERVVVLDFGLVSERAGTSSAGEVVGTAEYMAPEQAMGAAVGPAADWYAFGSMLYEALTGRMPFEAASVIELLMRKQREEPLSPALFAPDAPSDLVSLCRALLATDPAARPEEAAILATLGVSDDPTWVALAGFGAPETVFVGRKAEMATLEAAFERAREGGGATVVVDGESGVGKNALIDAFLRRLRTEVPEAVILRSRCHEQETVLYRAVDGLMDDLSRVLRRVERRRVARLAPAFVGPLLALFPCLDVVPGLRDAERTVPASESFAAPGQMRAQAFRATAELLRNVASRQPVVAVIDDVQWADLDSLALLEELLDPISSPPWLLLLAERRAEGAPPCAVRAMVRGAVETITLRGLGSDDARRLVRRLSDGLGLASSLDVDGLLADTGGHPLFLTQLVTHVSRARPSARGALQLDDALWAEMTALPHAALTLLATIAAASAPVALGTLAAACDLSPEAFVAELGRLRASRLVRVHGSRRSDTAETYHDRVRETVLARLSEDRRRAIHHQLGRALGDAGAEDDVLALHMHAAGDDDRALLHARKAAETLERAGAFGRAAQMWKMVLAIDDADATTTLLRLGDALGQAGRPKASAEAFLQAAARADASSDARFELERRATEQLLSGGFLEEGRVLAERLMGSVGLHIPRHTSVVLAGIVWHGWRARGAAIDAEPVAVAPAEAAARRLDARWTVGTGLSQVDPPVGMLLLSAGLRDALRHGDGFRRARALCAAALSEAAQGHTAHALRLSEATARAAETDGSDLARFYAALARVGYEFLAMRRVRPALEHLALAASLWRGAGRGAAWETAMLEQYTCWALWWTGDLAGLRARWETGLREARLDGHRYRETVLRVAFPFAHLMDDHVDLALTEIESAAASWTAPRADVSTVDFWGLESRTWTWLYAGKPAGAEVLEKAVDGLGRSLVGRVKVLAAMRELMLGRIAFARAEHARVAGDHREARAQLGRAVQWYKLYARRDEVAGDTVLSEARAAVAFAARDIEGGIQNLRRSIGDHERHGADALAAANRRRLGEWIGGEEGRAIAAEANEWLTRSGVRNTDAFVRMLAIVRPP